VVDIAMRPSPLLLIIPLVVLGVVAASVALKRGDWRRKGMALGVAVIAVGAIIGVFYRTKHLQVNDTGISSNAYGRIEIAWEQVESALYVPDLASSPYRPVLKISGVGMGAFRAGSFRLQNGERARVFTQQSDEALVLRAAGALYLFAPQEIQSFVQAVSAHVAVQGKSG
jgi:hypothetical protein